MASRWMSDVKVSMPKPADVEQPVVVDLGGGFGFTTGGIVHTLTQADHDLIATSPYAPEGFG